MKKEFERGYDIAMNSVKLLLITRITEIKESPDYPHHFTGQMVEDFEWVLGKLPNESVMNKF